MEYYSDIKKSEITPCVATWMHLENISRSEKSQTGKDKYNTNIIQYNVESKNNDTN